MNVFVVGAGQLANELRANMALPAGCDLLDWPARAPERKAVVIHAGSGRQLPQVLAFCGRTGSALLELATGTDAAAQAQGFPLVLCPNTNILMLKFMSMLAACGQQFAGYDISLTESHQAGKTSVPGTAVAIAASLGLERTRIRSLRDPDAQREELGVPAQHLHRHAWHRAIIRDTSCEVVLESKVFGGAPYAPGVGQLLQAVTNRPLENRVYEVDEFIRSGWV